MTVTDEHLTSARQDLEVNGRHWPSRLMPDECRELLNLLNSGRSKNDQIQLNNPYKQTGYNEYVLYMPEMPDIMEKIEGEARVFLIREQDPIG